MRVVLLTLLWSTVIAGGLMEPEPEKCGDEGAMMNMTSHGPCQDGLGCINNVCVGCQEETDYCHEELVTKGNDYCGLGWFTMRCAISCGLCTIDWNGAYTDNGGSEQTITQSGTSVTAVNPTQDWSPASGTVAGSTINMFGLTGNYQDGSISWSNGAVWTIKEVCEGGGWKDSNGDTDGEHKIAEGLTEDECIARVKEECPDATTANIGIYECVKSEGAWADADCSARGKTEEACTDVVTRGTCINKMDWVDNDGYDCADYEFNEWCADYGDTVPDNGVTANAACCACGGGDTCTDDMEECSDDKNECNLLGGDCWCQYGTLEVLSDPSDVSDYGTRYQGCYMAAEQSEAWNWDPVGMCLNPRYRRSTHYYKTRARCKDAGGKWDPTGLGRPGANGGPGFGSAESDDENNGVVCVRISKKSKCLTSGCEFKPKKGCFPTGEEPDREWREALYERMQPASGPKDRSGPCSKKALRKLGNEARKARREWKQAVAAKKRRRLGGRVRLDSALRPPRLKDLKATAQAKKQAYDDAKKEC